MRPQCATAAHQREPCRLQQRGSRRFAVREPSAPFVRYGRRGRPGEHFFMSRFFLVACLAACGGANVGVSATITDQLQDPTALAACAQGDAAANLAIVSDLRDSYHEMIVCGGLQLSFENALI